MSGLLEIREKLKSFYGRTEYFVLPILKFALAMICLLTINSKLGFMYKINNTSIVLIVSLICSFLPANMIVVFSALFIVLHIYALSMECAIVTIVIFVLMFLLYFRFAAGDALAVLLTPLGFALHIPYAVPLAAGFVSTPLSAISVGCGVVVYYVVNYFSVNANMLSNLEAESTVAKFQFVVDALLANKTMMVMAAVFAITVILVFIIKQLSVDYSWRIALVLGAVACTVMTFMGVIIMDLDISVASLALGMIMSVAVVIVLQFFVFCVDYSRTEKVQFEDDEYYYYVKAVPKLSVPSSEKKVKRINDDREELKTRVQKRRVEKTEMVDEDDVRVIRKNRLD